MAGAPTPAELVEELKALVAAHVAGSVELAARLNALVRKVASDPPAPAGDGSAAVARLAELGLASYAELSKHTLALLGGLVGVAERALAPDVDGETAGASASATPGQNRPADLRLSGKVGERVTSSFLVENSYDQAVDVSFRADALVSPGHDDLPATHIDFEPARLSILPRGSAVATAVVDITPEFAAGATYTSTVRLLGFEGKALRLAVAVAAGEARPAPARARKPKVRQAGGAAG